MRPNRATFLLLAVVLLVGISSAEEIKFTDLSKKRLPHGKAILITGETTGLAGGYMVVDKVAATYTISGLTSVSREGVVSGNKWSVPIDALPENASVSFTFQFSGRIHPDKKEKLIQALFSNEEFDQSLKTYFNVVKGQSSDIVLIQTRIFSDQLVSVLSGLVPQGIRLSAKKEFAKTFSVDVALGKIFSITNIMNSKNELIDCIPGVKEDSTFGEIFGVLNGYKKLAELKEAMTNNNEELICDQGTPEQFIKRAAVLAPGKWKDRKNFIKDYLIIIESLGQKISLDLEAQAELASSAGVKDLEKFVGLDYGSMYLPRINELRGFVTANVYFGPVEDAPAPDRNFFGQRVSLTFGIGAGDLSGNAMSKIKGGNIFLYGVGFRINKYFRLTAGSVVFRSVADDKLKNEFFVGPSMDISAFKELGRIFGK